MLVKRKIIEIDENLCDGCGLCVLDCAENAIEVVNGKARVVADHFCDGLGACLSACPRDALRIIEREAPPFDEAAVAARSAAAAAACAGACTGSLPRSYPEPPLAANAKGESPTPLAPLLSARRKNAHWPVKLRLVPSSAPFLRQASVLLAADCASAASPDFHTILNGRVLLTACPKFEEKEALTARLAEMLVQGAVRDIAVLRMEVPCCRGLGLLLKEAQRRAGWPDTVEETVMGCDGRPMGTGTY